MHSIEIATVGTGSGAPVTRIVFDVAGLQIREDTSFSPSRAVIQAPAGGAGFIGNLARYTTYEEYETVTARLATLSDTVLFAAVSSGDLSDANSTHDSDTGP